MSVFRLEGDGRYVDFRASTRDEYHKAVQAAATIVWNAIHPEDVAADVEAAKERLIERYGSAKAAVEAIMSGVVA